MKQDVDAFLEYLAKEKRYSSNTLSAYRNDLNQLMLFIDSEKAKGIIQSNWGLLKGYLLNLRERGYCPATIARKVASTKCFFKFLLDSDKIKEDPARKLISPRVSRPSPKFLSLLEYQHLLAEPLKLSTPEAKRDVVMLELLYATGLRVSELVSLNIKNIDLEHFTVNCSNKQVPFDASVGRLLRNFLQNDRLDLLFDEGEEALFLNRRGKRLTRQGFWQIMKNYASRAGLGDRATPHSLRHSFAMRKLQCGADLQSVQRLLGHAYLSSTRIYEPR